MDGTRVLLATTLVVGDRKPLACARSLARSGVRVVSGGDVLLGAAHASRHVERSVRYPHPARDPEGFVAAVGSLAVEHAVDVVLPLNDDTTVALSRYRHLLPEAVRIALAPAESIETARDKAATLSLAARLGIEVPETHTPANEEELAALARGLRFPCVVKPSSGAGASGVVFPESAEELVAAFRARRGVMDTALSRPRLLVQELLPGESRDACVVFRHGEPRAALTQRRRWTHPRRAGMGVSVETTHEPPLLERAFRILAALRWHGPACVEFRVDPRSGRTWLVEINGRLGGASEAGIRAGIDYPLLWTRLALDGDVPPVERYQVGLRFRWPVPFGLLALVQGAPIAAAREFLLPARDTHSDLRADDPLPHLADALYAARRFATKRFGLLRLRG